ncbi:putative bifunctional diguanylate cyclase/phosphodiesterase [Rugosimonospora africana]|uniref:PAS domain S-box-containing protein/diguanylate cyclase (GGDEF) domain-containing protein n=1 Tax=Rugosimonospora africana TaxID=556532 RepID=A0A8J3QW02_9ACTN|nr:EAL domain-containing protein [Rugosimonospora africana]GIH18124.1 hypothetical protein Raf01_62960 [Rugosimonospora africana]
MSVEPAEFPRSSTGRVSWALVPVAPALSCALLAAGTTGLLPRMTALAAAAAASTAVHAVLLICLALAAPGTRSPASPGRRSAALLGASLLATGATVVAAVAAESRVATNPLVDPFAARLGTAGLLLATLLFLFGLLLLPGPASGALARLHLALDGLAIGACLLYAAWLMVVHSHGGTHSPAAGVALFGCAGLATATVSGLRAGRYRPTVLICCTGGAVTIIGLGTAVALFAGSAPEGWLPVAALALVFGPVLCWAGTLVTESDPAPSPAERTDPGFAGYPILAVPVGTALAATAYRVAGDRPFDAVSVGLGLGVLAVLAVREVFAVLDIRRYARRIALQEARFRSLVSRSTDITVVLDDDLVVTWQSPSAAHQFGLLDRDVLDRPFLGLVHPEDAAAVRERLTALVAARPYGTARPTLLGARLRDGSGRWRETESTVSDQRSVPEVGALVVHVRDIGERRELERELHRMAFIDQLTGLPNRRQLLRTIAAMRAVPGQPGAILVVGLDDLAQTGNGRLPEVGDAVLVEVASRLRGAVEPSDRAARLSDTEFAVATADHPVHAYALAARVLAELTRPYPVAAATVHLGAAVGLAELAAATSVGDTLSRARLALCRAAQLRQGRIEWYDEALEAALLRRFRLEEELPGVIARGELDLVFQPILDLIDAAPVGAEALLRWRHPKRGTVPAADFVPVAEDLGLIDEIGEWVLRRACRQLANWLRDGLDLWLSVNLAARQLAAPNFVARVARVLDDYRIPADRLVVEITEQDLRPDLPAAVAQLTRLRTLGVRTALAKFGTGPTPLASLRRLPVDVLKVDRALFAGTPHVSPGGVELGMPVIDVVVGLGRRLGMEIVAEGLEDEAHLDLARAGGCRYGQGFLLGRPQPAEHFEAYLESHRSPTA